MTDLETRIAIALAARVRDVQPEPDAPARLARAMRWRRRRTRIGVPVVVGVVAAAVAAAFLLAPSSDPRTHVVPVAPVSGTPSPEATASPTTAPTALAPPRSPSVFPAPRYPVGEVDDGVDGVAALAGYGPVLIDPSARTARVLPGSSTPDGEALGLSHDGRYLVSGVGGDDASITVSDLSGRTVLELHTTTRIAAWSPVADVLAVVDEAGAPSLDLYRVGAAHARIGSVEMRAGPGSDRDLAWSPDGRHVAAGDGDGVLIADASGHRSASSSFAEGTSVVPAAWSGDGTHLVAFEHTGSASLDADGVQVVDLDSNGRRVGELPASLAESTWWHPLRGAAVLGTVGGFREVSSGKRVVRCDLAVAHCATLAGDAHTSAFAAVPTESGIAYLAAPDSGNDDGGFFPQPYRLTLARTDGSEAHTAPGAPATVAQVVARGHVLLLVGAGPAGPPGVYRYDGETATRIAAVSTENQVGYYGACDAIVDWEGPSAS